MISKQMRHKLCSLMVELW